MQVIEPKSHFLNGASDMSAKKFSNQDFANAHDPTRRELLTKTSLFAGGILAFGLPFLTGRSGSVFAAQTRQVIQSGGTVGYMLELDGALAGPLNSMEGGVVSGEIITYQDGNDLFLRKRLGKLKYEDIVLTCGTNLSLPFYQWLAGSLSGQGPRKNGAIVAVNQIGQIIDRREFQNVLVKEVVFPGLDAMSHDPAYLKVTLTPERIRYQSSSSRQTAPPSQANQSPWNTSKFRLLIQGLEQACTFIQRIEPLVVKQEIINYMDGGSSGVSRVRAGRVEVGNLVITLPQHQAEPFTEWFSSFVLQRQSFGNAKQGVLEFLSLNAQTVVAAVTLNHLGIFRMVPVTVGGSHQVQVEMYCESIQLTKFPGGSFKSLPKHKPPSRRRAPKRLRKGKGFSRIQKEK